MASVHVAAVRVPAVQELVPETVYPESHVGWHVDPLARELVQLPTAPFVGAVDASQDWLNTCTWPVPSFLGAPMSTRVSSEISISRSRAFSVCSLAVDVVAHLVHVPPLSEYTRTWPASVKVPSFLGAPIATRLPPPRTSTLSAQSLPSAASADMFEPTWVRVSAALRVYSHAVLPFSADRHARPVRGWSIQSRRACPCSQPRLGCRRPLRPCSAALVVHAHVAGFRVVFGSADRHACRLEDIDTEFPSCRLQPRRRCRRPPGPRPARSAHAARIGGRPEPAPSFLLAPIATRPVRGYRYRVPQNCRLQPRRAASSPTLSIPLAPRTRTRDRR